MRDRVAKKVAWSTMPRCKKEEWSIPDAERSAPCYQNRSLVWGELSRAGHQSPGSPRLIWA